VVRAQFQSLWIFDSIRSRVEEFEGTAPDVLR